MKKYPKNQTIILKLGGSVITKKTSSKAQLKEAVVKQIAKELKLFTQRFPEAKIIKSSSPRIQCRDSELTLGNKSRLS